MPRMSKAEFFKMRDEMWATGELKTAEPEHYHFELTIEQEQRVLTALGTQTSGVFRTCDIGLQALLCVEVYQGQAVSVQRRRIDELDNVTVWRTQ